MVSLILFVYLYMVSLDTPIRIGLNAYSRYQEHQADIYAVQRGYGVPLQHALIRSHAISLDPLFLSYIDQLLVANHPSMQDRVKIIEQALEDQPDLRNIANEDLTQLA